MIEAGGHGDIMIRFRDIRPTGVVEHRQMPVKPVKSA
jgi:hypothetical protein